MSFKLNLLELTIIKVLGRGRVWLFSWYRYFYFRVQNSSYGTRVPIFSHPPCIVELSETIFNVLTNLHFWFLILLPRSTVPYLFLQASGNAFLLNFDLLFFVYCGQQPPFKRLMMDKRWVKSLFFLFWQLCTPEKQIALFTSFLGQNLILIHREL